MPFPLNVSIFVFVFHAYFSLITHNLILGSLGVEKYLL